MHITGIGIHELPPLRNAFVDCHKRVNLFIGPNASGKSTILRALNAVYSGQIQRVVGAGDGDLVSVSLTPESDATVTLDLSEDWPRNSDDQVDETLVMRETVPLLYIPATRLTLPTQDLFDRSIHKPENFKTATPFKDLFQTESGIFNGRYVELAIADIRERVIQERRQQELFRQAMQVGYSCAKAICSEIIYDDVTHPYVEVNSDTRVGTARLVHHDMGIGTSDNVLGEPLYAGALSSGTQGTLLWIWALALQVLNHYRWTEGWHEKPAILLIDEIENHLHPTWQRRVIPALLHHFPGLQIFATTHSPFVVAGLKAGQVHLLNRDENGVVTAKTHPEDIIGWTADEILRNLMGVDEPTDQVTVDRANRLRQLREEETLTPEEESELDELRRQVNEDLLAKGDPLEVQRERYADLMREFLLSRQSDLTQDSG